MNAGNNPVKYESLAKPTTSLKYGLSQVPTINTAHEEMSKRVWIRRPDGNPTSLYVKENHLVDDLKMMIVEKFPTTLAKICDPSDIIIRVESSVTTPSSPNYFNAPNTPSSKKFMVPPIPDPSGSSLMTSFSPTARKSPLSPIPISAIQSSLISPGISSQVKNLADLHIGGVHSPASHILEPDKSVWGVLEQYFPNGQSVEKALIVEIPEHLSGADQNKQTQDRYSFSRASNSRSSRKSFSNETITEGREEEYRPADQTRKRNSSLPNAGVDGNPNIHRRTQSNPAEHAASPSASAVLLLPSSAKPMKRSSTDLTGHSVTVNARPGSREAGNNRGDDVNERLRNPGASKLGTGSTMAKVLPSINVLIVEDNLVNQKILSAHLRRHRIHYDVAKNGKEAIDKWRQGGFHLVLMDIQLPVMSGLDASREIRRLEKINHIGVFANSDLQNLSPKTEEDVLDLTVFRSPVIIVALTASNLRQDKHEALAAGCNDYLTKPVNLDWLLNKITEWGCMQALIDFDGWKSGERMTNISAAIPNLTRKSSSLRNRPLNDKKF